eukprot:CCRYP_014353-RA/>CCRYP_014353-RA protein AED:0.46 eAED:0.46 QI:0/-1/0/1/-1/1/1/0/123
MYTPPTPNLLPLKRCTPLNSGDAKSKMSTQRYVTCHVRDTIFTDQIGKFPQRSQAGNKYIMVMVEISSSAIIVEPIKNLTDAELTRAYSALMLRLQWAGATPHKHVLDNEVSLAMKDLIRDTS